jgi:hypothetical protein
MLTKLAAIQKVCTGVRRTVPGEYHDGPEQALSLHGLYARPLRSRVHQAAPRYALSFAELVGVAATFFSAPPRVVEDRPAYDWVTLPRREQYRCSMGRP